MLGPRPRRKKEILPSHHQHKPRPQPRRPLLLQRLQPVKMENKRQTQALRVCNNVVESSNVADGNGDSKDQHSSSVNKTRPCYEDQSQHQTEALSTTKPTTTRNELDVHLRLALKMCERPSSMVRRPRFGTIIYQTPLDNPLHLSIIRAGIGIHFEKHTRDTSHARNTELLMRIARLRHAPQHYRRATPCT